MKTAIITMATENYLKWAPTWIDSVKKHYPGAHIKIYTINCTARFCGIVTRKLNIQTDPGRYGRVKVTYLKGQCIKNTLRRDFERVIWLDITAIFRAPVEAPEGCGVALVYRGGQGVLEYCAELQVWEDLKEACRYDALCKQAKEAWYSDQAALRGFPDALRLPHPDYCNLEYDESARSWSARGPGTPPNNGIHSEGDEAYALRRFRDDLYKPKPRILAFIDDRIWCFKSTADRIMEALSHKYEFVPVHDVAERRRIREGDYDLVWSRAAAHRVAPLLDYRPEYTSRVISSITTGGKLLENRVEKHFRLEGQLGVICQNSASVAALSGDPRNGKTFLIPNGVDLQEYRPEVYPDIFTAGFAGRTTPRKADVQKGYSDFVMPACEAANVPLVTASQGSGQLSREDMPGFYNSVSVVLQPSDAEGCSNTIMEAMACGRVCIITRVGYHGERCDGRIDSPGAEVIFVNRDAEEISEVMMRLRSDNKTYNRISRNARAFAELHSWDRQIQLFDDAFGWGIRVTKNGC